MAAQDGPGRSSNVHLPVVSAGKAEWPAVVFDAAVLRGLDTRARHDLESAGRLLSLGAGDVVYRAGEGGESFFVVAGGRVDLRAVRRGEDGESDLRSAADGEVFGEEATVGAARRATATVTEEALIAEIPVPIFRRVAVRSGRAEMAEKLERILRRSATRDLLGTLSFTRELDAEDIDILLDAAVYKSFDRGEPVYRQGDAAAELWLIADGMVQIQTDDGDRLHVRAYLLRGDFFGDMEITERIPRAASAVASGPSLLLAIPAKVVRALADRHPELLPRLRRLAADQHAVQQAIVGGAAAHTTQHIFRDLYRLQVARSLLVIDLESCVRCGHCAWACSALYGVSRLVRRGDKVVARVRDQAAEAPQSLLLPNSCQHCENPGCMIDCPTGAIGRDPEGDVFIRSELCTGCGACARACPWDNIQMGPRPPGEPRPKGAAEYPDLAVKCDLCRGYDGPACVQVCPTGSIFRVNPAEEIADIRDLLGGGRRAEAERRKTRGRGLAPAPTSAGALIAGSAVASAAIGMVGVVMQSRGLFQPSSGLGYAAGIGAAASMLLLLLYAAPKRGVRLWMRRRKQTAGQAAGPKSERPAVASIMRPQLNAHLAIGLVSIGLVAMHTPWPVNLRPTLGSALSIVFLLTAVAGGWAAVAYRLLPGRLARLERTAALPEDFTAARRELVERLYRDVSGKSDLVKKIFEKILLPYVKNRLGPWVLFLSGRRLREEEQALRARIDGVLQGRGEERLAGLAELIRIVVELRALSAQRWLLRALRVGLPVHVVTFGIAIVLLVLHVVTVTGRF